MSRTQRHLLVALLTIAGATGCQSLSKTELRDAYPAAAAYARKPDLQRMVADLADPVIAREETPGLIVGVLLADGSRHFHGFGTIAAGQHVLPEADTVFPVGSLTKSMVAALLELEVRRGRLSWDDTLGDMFPDVALSPDAGRITLLQLATHTSGLPRQPRSLKILSQFVEYLFTGRDFYRDLDRDMAFAYLSTWSNPDKDGEPTFRYSNLGYALLAHAIKHRRGSGIGAIIAQEITGPLHLDATAIDPDDVPPELPRASGHAGDQPKFIARGTPLAQWAMNDFMLGTGGLHSNAADLLRYLQAHLAARHTGADPRTEVEAALAGTLRDRIAWLPLGEPQDGFLYQFGVMSGNSAFMGIDPQRGIGVVVLQNSFNWTDHIGRNLIEQLALAHDLSLAAPRAMTHRGTEAVAPATLDAASVGPPAVRHGPMAVGIR